MKVRSMSNAQPSLSQVTQIVEQLNALNAELNSHSMGAVLHILQGASLSMARLAALFYLQRRGAATISELSEHLNLALGSTSQAVDHLVQAGFAERREDTRDRRHKLVTLTPAGAEIVAQVRQVRSEEVARRLAELPPELVDRLGETIADVLDALRQPQAV